MTDSIKPIHVYGLASTRKKLEALSKAHHRSMSAEVQMLIEEAYTKLISEKTQKP